jgi:hypothetical protein
MALPTLTHSCAFTTNPGSTPTWVNLSSPTQYGGDFNFKRGRRSESEKVQTGKGSVTLNNSDRRFDPTNTSGAHYPNVVPMRRWRTQADWSSVTYDLFGGYVDDWIQVWDSGVMVIRAQAAVSDGYVVFQNAFFSSPLVAGVRQPRAAERSDLRIGWVLDQIGWPAGDRALDTGVINIQAYPFDRYGALQHIEEVADAEQGLFYIRADGVAVFKNRWHRVFAPYTTSYATFGENAGELDYYSMDEAQGSGFIENDVQVKRANVEGAAIFSYQDSASITKYRYRSKSFDLWAAYDAEIESVAQVRVMRYRESEPRITQLELKPQGDSTLWPHALGREIGDQILVKQRFNSIGSVLSQASRIEGIEHDFKGGVWTTTWDLTPVPVIETTDYWQLGEAGSQLGGNTVLIF